MTVASSIADSPITLKLVGTFGPAALHRLQAAVEWSRTTHGDLVIDLSGVEALPDRTMPALSESLAKTGGRVRLMGLRDHQMRILRYLGLEV
jgi:anti-anti-sigma regulatory factor